MQTDLPISSNHRKAELTVLKLTNTIESIRDATSSPTQSATGGHPGNSDTCPPQSTPSLSSIHAKVPTRTRNTSVRQATATLPLTISEQSPCAALVNSPPTAFRTIDLNREPRTLQTASLPRSPNRPVVLCYPGLVPGDQAGRLPGRNRTSMAHAARMVVEE